MFYLVAVFLIIILLLLLSAVWPPDSPWSPWWKTYKTAGRAAIKIGSITSKDKVYELGSGDGEFLLLVSREVGAQCIGIEIDPLRHVIATLRKKFARTSKLTFKKKSFYDENLSSATVIYMYLIPRVLKKITPKLKEELKKETRIISYRYTIPDLKLIKEDKKEKLFLYKI